MITKAEVKVLMDRYEPVQPRDVYRAYTREEGIRDLKFRDMRASELSAADMWGLANLMTGPSGHGEGGFSEYVIKRQGSWGSGDYPPVFTSLPQAFAEAERLHMRVAPLRYFVF